MPVRSPDVTDSSPFVRGSSPPLTPGRHRVELSRCRLDLQPTQPIRRLQRTNDGLMPDRLRPVRTREGCSGSGRPADKRVTEFRSPSWALYRQPGSFLASYSAAALWPQSSAPCGRSPPSSKATAIADGPVFRQLWLPPQNNPSGPPPLPAIEPDALTPRSIARILQDRAVKAGFGRLEFGGHSLKRGALTAGMQAGAHPAQLKRLGRYKSFDVLGEYRIRQSVRRPSVEGTALAKFGVSNGSIADPTSTPPPRRKPPLRAPRYIRGFMKGDTNERITRRCAER